MANPSIHVAVLKGGDSPEAAVSRSSAAGVAGALEAQPGIECTEIELDQNLIPALQACSPDVVFPVLHGPPGEDGTIQGLLEMMGLSYVGSAVQPSAFAMDKSVAKALFAREGLPLAKDLVVTDAETPAAIAGKILQELGPAVVIKPMQLGSSLGVTPLPNGGDLEDAVKTAFEYGSRILIEPFVMGREITVGILDLVGKPAQALPVTEIQTASGEWYDYHNRYTAGASEHIIPAPMSDTLATQLQTIALQAHECLGLRDLSRADFIVTDSDEVVLLEVNSLPGMTPTSLYPDSARAAGYEFGELMVELVRCALARRAAEG